jgi:hypothetical protein
MKTLRCSKLQIPFCSVADLLMEEILKIWSATKRAFGIFMSEQINSLLSASFNVLTTPLKRFVM